MTQRKYGDETIISADGSYRAGYVDEYGNRIERTPMTHPHGYDGYVTHRAGENKEVHSTIYSDRLSQWDYKKTDTLKRKHFGDAGDWWNTREPKAIQAFLSEYFSRPIKIIFIMQYCNLSSGYPCWRFDVRYLDKN